MIFAFGLGIFLTIIGTLVMDKLVERTIKEFKLSAESTGEAKR